MHRKRPSIKDVAARSGVSTATVSNVFSGKKRVKATLAAKVRRAADDLGYAVDRVASQMRTGRARVVAIIVPDLEDLFLNRFVACVEAHAVAGGFDVIVACSHNDPTVERSRLLALLAWRPAGLVVVPCGDRVPALLLDAGATTPIVCADRIEPGTAPFDTVTLDNSGAGRAVADHLIARAARSVLFVTATLDLFTIRERVRGARERIGLERSVGLDIVQIGSDPVPGAARLADWLRANGRPDSIVGATNMMTLAALAALAELRLDTPRDVLLVGFHDSLWMTARRVPVTTVAQPVDDVARCAWDRLERRMAGDTSATQNILLSSRLIERASTCGRVVLEAVETR